MFKSVRVGSVLGIPLRLDITFLLIVPIFAFIIGSEIEVLIGMLEPLSPTGLDSEALTGGYTPWLLGLAAALGLFACVAAHELGHSVVAMHYGYHIDSITLWLLGGLAKLTETPRHWSHEFAIAIAGPVVSVAFGAMALVPLLGVQAPAVVTFLLLYLGLMNVALAAFNMIPAFPMDGGRVLRALLARKRPLPRATKLAAETGKGVAVLLGLWGLFVFNPVLIGIAGFIYISASGETRRVFMEDQLGDVPVESVMTPIEDLRLVGPRVSIASLRERMSTEGQAAYPVVEDGRPLGIVTTGATADIGPAEQGALEVRDRMTTQTPSVRPRADALATLSRMRSVGVDHALVIDRDGDLAGLLARGDVTRRAAGAAAGWDALAHRPEAHRD